MKIFISIVSHNNSELILNNDDLLKINRLDDVSICIKDNVGEKCLADFCIQNNIYYVSESKGLGFGANNNHVFNFILEKLKFKEDDYFLLLNPDVYITEEYFKKLQGELTTPVHKIFTVDLFRDESYTERDLFIRKFPRFIDFIQSFIFKKNNTIVDRSNGVSDKIDWCAGSFQGYQMSTYNTLKGFDEGYFMYCEDIDICYRAKCLGFNIKYFSNIKALHLAQHSNRSVFSKHFMWHVKSIFRYLFLSNLPRFSKSMGLKFFSSLK